MAVLRGTLVSFASATGTAVVRLDASPNSALSAIRVSRALPSGELVAGRRVVVDTGDHLDENDAVLTAVFDPANTAYGASAVAAQPPKRIVLPDLTRFPHALRYDSTLDPAGAVWPSANRAIYVPFEVDETVTVNAMHFNVTTTGGNYDIGLYTVAGVRLTSRGSTAVPGAGVASWTLGAPQQLTRGRYFAALALSLATAGVLRVQGPAAIPLYDLAGVKNQNAALPLPAPATFAAPVTAYLPVLALELA